MKKFLFFGIVLLVSGLLACGGGSSESSDDSSSSMRELQLDETVTDSIAEVGEVDWYHYNAVEANRTLTVSCDGTQGHAMVDFMLTVYERNAAGEMVPIFGKSWPENSAQAADIDIKVHIDQPRHLYFAVRDFKDDKASEGLPYRIRVGYSSVPIDNETFAQAVDLTVGAGQCQRDTIAQVNEVNCYRFQVGADGVYNVVAQYTNTGVPVNLGLELYDEVGQLIHQFNGAAPPDRRYMLMVHLTPGIYYLTVEDQGRNDTSAFDYTLCVDAAANVAEVAANDDMATADSETAGVDGYELDGSLEYIQDQDWYQIAIPAAAGTTSQNVKITFHTGFNPVPESLQRSTNPDGYLISVIDANGTVLHAYEHPIAVTTLPYNVQIGANPAGGAHYVVVQPMVKQQMLVAMPYLLQVEVVAVNDVGENPDGTESITALDPPSDSVDGKIYKLGDVDNYTMAVDTTTAPKIVEVFFDAAAASEVDYTVHVSAGGHQYTLRDINGTDAGAANTTLGIPAIAAGAHMKSSFFVASGTEVRLTVCDDQNNDGSDVDYTMQVRVRDVFSGDIGSVPSSTGSTVYFSEAAEQAANATNTNEVTVVESNIYNTLPSTFMANTALLRVGALDGQFQWKSPWIAGFVDYDGDRDLFELSFDGITKPEAWYFDIQIQLYAANSPVEYSWVLFRDRETVNNVLLERTFWDDSAQGGAVYSYQYNNDGEGIVAGWADQDPGPQVVNRIVPSGTDGLFWIGNVWGASKFYLSLQDFNRTVVDYTTTTTNEQTIRVPNPANQVPDNDWGDLNSQPAAAPYYFQVTVTMHSGVSDPYAQ
ncbi:MAG: hypothetical protein WAU91_09735 [Desulfatitalea sp.]